MSDSITIQKSQIQYFFAVLVLVAITAFGAFQAGQQTKATVKQDAPLDLPVMVKPGGNCGYNCPCRQHRPLNPFPPRIDDPKGQVGIVKQPNL